MIGACALADLPHFPNQGGHGGAGGLDRVAAENTFWRSASARVGDRTDKLHRRLIASTRGL